MLHRLPTFTLAASLALLLPALGAHRGDGDLTSLDLPWLTDTRPHGDEAPSIAVECALDRTYRVVGEDAVRVEVIPGPARFAELTSALASATKGWEARPVGGDEGVGPPIDVAHGTVVVRASARAPFAPVQHLLGVCASLERPAMRFEFACRDAGALEAGRIRLDDPLAGTDALEVCVPFELPVGISDTVDTDDSTGTLTLELRVHSEGTRVERGTGKAIAEGDDANWRYGDDRVLAYRLGPWHMAQLEDVKDKLTAYARRLRSADGMAVRLRLDARHGITYGEALAAHQALMSSGLADSVEICGSYE